jgi:hypothetical protein
VIGGLLIVLVASLGLAGCSSTARGVSPTTLRRTAGGPAAQQVYDRTLTNVSHASSVRFVATSTGTSSSGRSLLQLDANVAASDASNDATWSGVTESGAKEKGAFSIILIGPATYLKADAESLTSFFGAIPAGKAGAYSGKWISFVPADKLYSSLRLDLTLVAIATSLEFRPEADHSLAAGGIVVTGRPLSSSTPPAGEHESASMTISGTSYLPESQLFVASDGGTTDTSSIRFTKWDSAAPVTAPAASVTWASVAAAMATKTPG